MSGWEGELRRRQWWELYNRLYKERMDSAKAYDTYERFAILHDSGPFCQDWWTGGWMKFLPENERKLTPKIIDRLKKVKD